MKLCSYLTDSFTEYEGEHSLVVFTKECNLNCYGCYNKNLMRDNDIDFIDFLDNYVTPLHTAIVFLGGEPTCNSQLKNMLNFVINRYPQLKTKVFSNGLNFEIIQQIEPFVDTFSIDFKTYYNKNNLLGKLMSGDNYRNSVIKTLDFLYLKGKVSEIRTVRNPKLAEGELETIEHYVTSHYPNAKYIVSEFIKEK